jgi:hypothetical protein
MKALVVLLAYASLSAQPKVSGKLVDLAGDNAEFVSRNTKVVLLTKTTRDTVSVNEKLAFEFPKAEAGTAYLYLVSPVVPRNVDYKFRVKKNKPTEIALKYDRFRHPPQPDEKTPEERQEELMTGLFIARVAIDLIFLLRHLH